MWRQPGSGSPEGQGCRTNASLSLLAWIASGEHHAGASTGGELRSGDTGNYYQALAGARLKQCYDVAPPRVQQALDAEVSYVSEYASPGSIVLELGCGYGRVLKTLATRARVVVGVDTSMRSLQMARDYLGGLRNWRVAAMDAANLALGDGSIDVAVCIQNGLSAFKVDPRRVVEETLRVVRPGGTALFSSYAARFWDSRLEWFRIQADHHLIGAIDESLTGAGVIVCEDGFRAATFGQEDFENLADGLGAALKVVEVDNSTVFGVMRVGPGT